MYGGGNDTIVSLGRMGLQTLVAMLVFANAEGGLLTARRSLLGFLVGINVLSVSSVACFVLGGFHSSEYTLGINKNGLGAIFGCGVVVALAFLMTEFEFGKRRIWLTLTLGGAVVGLLLCLSRGAWIATSVALLFILLSTGRTKAFLGSLVLIAALVGVTWSMLPEEATDYATDVSPDTKIISSRFDAMETAMASFRSTPLLGVGVGLRKQVEPHNVIILTLGETGIAGLVTFLFAFGAAFYTLSKALRVARGEKMSYQIVLAGTAVMLVTTIHGQMDVYWRRGVGVLGWASVGMAASILASVNQQISQMSLRLPPPLTKRQWTVTVQE
jgi:O-antigen ligase